MLLGGFGMHDERGRWIKVSAVSGVDGTGGWYGAQDIPEPGDAQGRLWVLYSVGAFGIETYSVAFVALRT